MIGRIIRVVFGFVLACLAAGLAVVLFVYVPFELSDLQSERLVEIGIMSLAAATQTAIFAAPFALIGVVFGEWQRIGSWMYYVLLAMAVAAIGFLVQFWKEAGAAEGTIVNSYAVTAFLVAGFVAGIVYWLFSGRFGRASAGPEPDIMPPPRRTAPANGPPAPAAT
jgi:hypothetical protein